jgi:alkylation response protein AidB-like acyl-CoA dehydrogenase
MTRSRIASARDIAFMLYDWLDVERLCTRERFAAHGRDTFDAVLGLAERLAADCFAGHNRKADSNEPAFDGERVRIIPEVQQALRAFADAGLFAASAAPEHGGMGLPYVVERAYFAWFLAANVGTVSYPLLTMANANLIAAQGSPAQIDTFALPEYAGRWYGTMCLSEPHAGSSLGDLRTRAEPDGDDELGARYRLFGNKMWISGGDHELAENIVHLVLARIPDAEGRVAAGTQGVSLFVVPKFLPTADGGIGARNDVALAGLNHKLGHRGTTNCLLNFGEGRWQPGGRAGAIGWRIGAVGQGLKCMFQMMNEARIGVGFGAVMLGYTGYLHALDYARSRPQGRPPGTRDPNTPQVPIIRHADVRRMLLAQKSYVEGGLALGMYCALLIDDAATHPDAAQRVAAALLLDLLTPIAKAWPAEWCLAANDLAIQVHGGAGYTRDYAVEQFWRDNRLNPIHEGTNGIQAIDLLGRKVAMQDGAAMALLGERIAATLRPAAGADADTSAQAEALGAMWRRLVEVTRQTMAIADVEHRLANAHSYLLAFGHVVVAWLWLEQSLAAQRLANDRDRDFVAGKRQACRYFYRCELVRVPMWLDLVASGEDSALTMQEAWF